MSQRIPLLILTLVCTWYESPPPGELLEYVANAHGSWFLMKDAPPGLLMSKLIFKEVFVSFMMVGYT